MKKVLVFIGAVTIGFFALFGIYSVVKIIFSDKPQVVTVDDAVSDEENRYIIVTNSTGKVINKVTIYTGEHLELYSESNEEALDKKNYSFKIDRKYSSSTSFIIELIDRNELMYAKKIENVPETGYTEVSVTTDDYQEQSGDWWKKINAFFNGD